MVTVFVLWAQQAATSIPAFLKEVAAIVLALGVVLTFLAKFFRPHIVRFFVGSMHAAAERATWKEGIDALLEPTLAEVRDLKERTARNERSIKDVEKEMEHRLKRIEENGESIEHKIDKLIDLSGIQAIQLARLEGPRDARDPKRDRLHGA